jgi:hypothetical protein
MSEVIYIEKFQAGSLELSTVPYTLIKKSIVNDMKDLGALGLCVYILCCQVGNTLKVTKVAKHLDCSEEEINRRLDVLVDMGILEFT